jgi:hypothetical protein
MKTFVGPRQLPPDSSYVSTSGSWTRRPGGSMLDVRVSRLSAGLRGTGFLIPGPAGELRESGHLRVCGVHHRRSAPLASGCYTQAGRVCSTAPLGPAGFDVRELSISRGGCPACRGETRARFDDEGIFGRGLIKRRCRTVGATRGTTRREICSVQRGRLLGCLAFRPGAGAGRGPRVRVRLPNPAGPQRCVASLG